MRKIEQGILLRVTEKGIHQAEILKTYRERERERERERKFAEIRCGLD